MLCEFFFIDLANFDFSELEASTWIKSLILSKAKECGDISILFCSDAEILRINNEALQHDYYTDIITFDYTHGDIISGELYISVDMVHYNVSKFSTNFECELHRVMAHGILHLLGYKDSTEDEQEEMSRQEELALDLFYKDKK